MKPMKQIALFAVTSSLALMAATHVQAETFSANSIRLENLVGMVEIITTTGSEVRLDMEPGTGVMDLPQVDVKNGVAKIHYRDRVRVRSCNSRGKFLGKDDVVSVRLKGGSKHDILDYPSYRIHVPIGTDLSIRGGAVFGKAGNLGSADLSIDSCGDFSVGDVTGDLKAKVNGSGDIQVGLVGGALYVGVNGSGDVKVGAVSGDAELRINGSGDIEVGIVQALQASINGSGDIEVGSATGEVDLSINGSGDIKVAGGQAAPLEASIRGSGDIGFFGHASGVKVYVSGSGDIVVDSFDGDLDTGGHRIEIQIDDGRLHIEG